MICIYLFDSS